METHSFTLSGVASSGSGDPLGIWTVSQESGVSFGAQASATEARAPTWRVELPEFSESAQAVLADRGQAMELTRSNLKRASQEIDRLSPAAPSFSPTEEFAAQKNALLQAVHELKEPVSYGLLEKIQDQEGYRQWMALVERVRQMVSNYARIETAIGGLDVGVTTVGWSGDFVTTWEAGALAAGMQMHLRSVHLVLDSRIALMRIVSVVATGAAGLAVKATIPSGQVLLLPAAWRFVRDVLQELRQSWPQLEYLVQ